MATENNPNLLFSKIENEAKNRLRKELDKHFEQLLLFRGDWYNIYTLEDIFGLKEEDVPEKIRSLQMGDIMRQIQTFIYSRKVEAAIKQAVDQFVDEARAYSKSAGEYNGALAEVQESNIELLNRIAKLENQITELTTPAKEELFALPENPNLAGEEGSGNIVIAPHGQFPIDDDIPM